MPPLSRQDIHFVHKSDSASPVLFKSCATGQQIKKAVLFVRKAGGDQQEFMKVTMEDIIISSYKEDGGPEMDPTDAFSINFAKIEYFHARQSDTGGTDFSQTAAFDVKAGRSG